MDLILTRIGGILRIDGLDDPDRRAIVRVGLILAAAAIVVRVVYWAYTGRYWEDALITCLHAENLVSGLGLTHYRPGEPPLQGFTSPLSVLVPLIGDLIHVGFGVDFIKLASLPAAALTVLFVLGIGLHPQVRLPGPLIGLVMGYVAFDHNQILWAASGMETQFAVMALIMSLYYAMSWKPLPLGIGLGVCMLARPDFAFWTAVVGIYGLFKVPRQLLLRVVPAALVLYLPWTLFTFFYYGSSIPNTIIAKGLGYPKFFDHAGQMTWAEILNYTWMRAAARQHHVAFPAKQVRTSIRKATSVSRGRRALREGY